MDLTTMCSKFFDNDKNKQQLKVLLKPMVNMILHELKPYIYALVIFISIIFLLMMSIFILQIKLYKRYNPCFLCDRQKIYITLIFHI